MSDNQEVGSTQTQTPADEYKEIVLSDSAQAYLADLLDKQDDEVLGIRIFINDPGTSKAETCIAYAREADLKEDDLQREYNPEDGRVFKAFFDAKSWKYLEAANVDYAADRMGGQLTIKAPNSKMPQVNPDSPIEERINYVLYTEVNPSLAAHGGEVSLVTVDDENHAVLRFGGGCQGCGAVEMTLKDGVEKTLLERIPELEGVKDMTDHTDKSNAYY